jgi:hypothetical protein
MGTRTDGGNVLLRLVCHECHLRQRGGRLALMTMADYHGLRLNHEVHVYDGNDNVYTVHKRTDVDGKPEDPPPF